MAQLPQDPAAAAQAAPPQQAEQPDQGGGGGAKELLMGAHEAMSKLAEAMSQSGQVDEGDIQQASEIVSMIEALAQSLGNPKGGKAPGGPVPEQAGVRPVQPAM